MVIRRCKIDEVLFAANAMVVEWNASFLLSDVSPLHVVPYLGHILLAATIAWRRDIVLEKHKPVLVKWTVKSTRLEVRGLAMIEDCSLRTLTLSGALVL